MRQCRGIRVARLDEKRAFFIAEGDPQRYNLNEVFRTTSFRWKYERAVSCVRCTEEVSSEVTKSNVYIVLRRGVLLSEMQE